MATIGATAKQQYVERFGAAERMEHIVLIISFSMLAVTGLPQRYADVQIAKDFIELLGGIESVRIMHRFFATLLMAGSIYHGGVLTYKVYVRGSSLNMLPTVKDARDLIGWVLHNLGLSKEHPKMGRYNFGEKAEYLALVWGTLVMIVTGFMMWNPIATSKVLPSEVIPAARLAHSSEALLAVLSIIIWHMYNVHVRRFNKAMFTGKMPVHHMEEEHALELVAIQAGTATPVIPDAIMARRNKRFWPYAVFMTILLTSGLIFFVSFEDTAIHTVPRQPVEESITIDPAKGNAEAGATKWQTLPCARCHGETGAGVPPIPAITNTALDFKVFAADIRRGPADMPAYGPGQVSEQDIADLYAFLRSNMQ
ncbi:MAG: c-type cytochrome [Chloroflexi bacterium]|nr:c-type cytochrome [Chloroflexota bacterium]